MTKFVQGYLALHDGLSDMIETGRLTEPDITDDYEWLTDKLTELAGVEPPRDVTREYATLRVAMRNALYRVFGSSISDVSPIFRSIEAGMTAGDATDALETHLRALVQKERDDAQAVYKRPAR